MDFQTMPIIAHASLADEVFNPYELSKTAFASSDALRDYRDPLFASTLPPTRDRLLAEAPACSGSP